LHEPAADNDHSPRTRAIGAAPVLIVGAPRSGTTWVQRLLLADPRFCGGQESHFFVSFGRVLRDFDQKRDLPRSHGLSHYWSREDLVSTLRGLWLRTVAPVVAAAPDASVLVEKTPDHARCLDVVREIVPGARVVHVIRDSRAVVASLLAAGRAPWGEAWAPKSLGAAIAVWRTHVEAVLAEGDRVTAIRYEDLHLDPCAQLSRLHGALGVASDAPRVRAAVEAASREAVQAGMAVSDAARPSNREPEGFVRHGTVDGWRRELSYFARRRVWRETRELMQAAGYSEDGAVPRA
jgi:hypothetical protein